eukprot:m51a1_g6936 hypothetical protein (232) ;mRNA; f:211447-212304
MTAALLVATAALLAACAGASGALPGCLVLHAEPPVMRLRWDVVDEHPMPPALRFRLEVADDGASVSAVAWGISPSSGFFGVSSSDVFIVIPNRTTGGGAVQDGSFRMMKIREDEHNDLSEIRVETTDTAIVAEFRRDVVARHDTEDTDILLTGGQQVFMCYWQSPEGGRKGRPADMALVDDPVEWVLERDACDPDAPVRKELRKRGFVQDSARPEPEPEPATTLGGAAAVR